MGKRRRGGPPPIPSPSVAVSLKKDGKYLVSVSMADRDHNPRIGVPVAFIQGGEAKTEFTDPYGKARHESNLGKIVIEVPGFPAIEKDLEKPSGPKLPAKPVVHICGQDGKYNLAISIIDGDGGMIKNAMFMIMDSKATPTIRDLTTGETGVFKEPLVFDELERFITVVVPPGTPELVWTKRLFGPRKN